MTPKQIFDRMMEKDAHSKWLNIELVDIAVGYCSLKMVIRPEFCNGFGIVHGGVLFALADSTLAFAANSFGNHAPTIEANIKYFKPAFVDETIYTQAKIQHRSKALLHYIIEINNMREEKKAILNGMSFVKNEIWN